MPKLIYSNKNSKNVAVFEIYGPVMSKTEKVK